MTALVYSRLDKEIMNNTISHFLNSYDLGFDYVRKLVIFCVMLEEYNRLHDTQIEIGVSRIERIIVPNSIIKLREIRSGEEFTLNNMSEAITWFSNRVMSVHIEEARNNRTSNDRRGI